MTLLFDKSSYQHVSHKCIQDYIIITIPNAHKHEFVIKHMYRGNKLTVCLQGYVLA